MKKPERFKTQIEIWNYLQEKPGNMVKYVSDVSNGPIILRNGNLAWANNPRQALVLNPICEPTDWYRYSVPKWYDGLEKRTEGVLCKVWDDDEDPHQDIDTTGECSTINFALICGVFEDPGTDMVQFIDVYDRYWDHAVPVNDLSELGQYLLKYN
jgi:hypothetical protein